MLTEIARHDGCLIVGDSRGKLRSIALERVITVPSREAVRECVSPRSTVVWSRLKLGTQVLHVAHAEDRWFICAAG